METEENIPCLVGYALNPKKLRKSEVKISGSKTEWAGGGLADIVEPSSSSSNTTAHETLKFLPWDSSLAPTAQPSFQVIIHKLTDFKNEEEEEKIKALEHYLHTHPQTKIIDPIANVRRVTTRLQTILYLQKSQLKLGKYCPFTQPNYLVVSKDMTSLEIEEQLLNHKIVFPIICKPLKACGTPDSHSMVIVVRKEDCFMIPRPCIIQQYYDHQGILFKAYVIDQEVMVYRRPSLPNLAKPLLLQQSTPALLDSHHYTDPLRLQLPSSPPLLSTTTTKEIHSLAFDSRYCYPKLENFLHIHEYSAKACESPKVWRVVNNSSSSHKEKKLLVNLSHLTETTFSPKQKKVKIEPPTAASSERSPPQDNNEMSVQQVTQELLTSTELSKDSELFDRFVATAKELRETFGLTLFGFDVILPQYPLLSRTAASTELNNDHNPDEDRPEIEYQISQGCEANQTNPWCNNQLMVIDINYFPSYKEVKDFPDRLKRYLRKRALE